jgi:adenylate kinase
MRTTMSSSERAALKVIIAGAPAAGKGTQCENIKRDFGVIHLSTGDILRAAVKEGTPLGVKAKGFMDAGQLVPDELITDVVCSRLKQPDCKEKGWLLDGFPRTKPQAESLSAAGFKPDAFVLLDVPEQVLVERVTGRRTDPETGAIYHLKFKPPPAEVLPRLVQRSDDTEEKIVVRYKEFVRHVDAVKGFYEDKCIRVDGAQAPETVSSAITEGLKDAEKDVLQRKKKAILLSRVVTIASLAATDKALGAALKRLGLNLPASLVGMIGVFSSLLALDVVCPPGSDLIARFAAPTVALTKVWLPLLFVPPLVVLPLKLSLFRSAWSGALMSIAVAVGAVLSLSSAGAVAEATRSLESSFRTGSILKALRRPSKGAVPAVAAGPFGNYAKLTPEQLTMPLPSLSSPKVPVFLASLMLANGVYLARFSANGGTAAARHTLLKLFGVYSTIASFLTASTVVPVAARKFAPPVLVTALLTLSAHTVASVAMGTPLSTLLWGYYGGQGAQGAGDLISSLLGPAIISLGLQLYTYRRTLFENSARMTLTTAFAAGFGLVSSALLARLANLGPAPVALSLLTRCITTPLALAGAALTGADASLSALVVVVTGLLGASFGNSLIEAAFKPKKGAEAKADAISVGLAIGAGAHGLGASAVATEPLKFASAIVSMCLTGFWTVLLLSVPSVNKGLRVLSLGA